MEKAAIVPEQINIFRSENMDIERPRKKNTTQIGDMSLSGLNFCACQRPRPSFRTIGGAQSEKNQYKPLGV